MSVAAQAHAIAQATRASGVIVQLEPRGFMDVLQRTENPVVIVAVKNFFGRSYQYLTSYKGLAFHTKSPVPLNLPVPAEIVAAKRIWVP